MQAAQIGGKKTGTELEAKGRKRTKRRRREDSPEGISKAEVNTARIKTKLRSGRSGETEGRPQGEGLGSTEGWGSTPPDTSSGVKTEEEQETPDRPREDDALESASERMSDSYPEEPEESDTEIVETNSLERFRRLQ